MCDVGGDGDPCDVWKVTTPRARKVHACTECGLPIVVGVVHTRIGALSEGRWDSYRMHSDCYSLLKHVAHDVCGQTVHFIGVEPLRDRVREHMHEAPEVLTRWRDILRARRAEGVWPVRRAA